MNPPLSDSQLRTWWVRLSMAEKDALFLKMMTRAPSESFAEFAESLRDRWNAGYELTTKQLAAIKRWDRK